VFVEDFADLIFAQSTIQDNVVMDAVGPENFKFTEILDLLKKAVGSKALIMKFPEQAAMIAVKAMGVMVNDVVMTDDELRGLSLDLLESHAPPTCTTKLSDWVNANSDWLGKKYFSEVKKHYT
jgi:NADH dehydrogenase